jgi:hypothetical protein
MKDGSVDNDFPWTPIYPDVAAIMMKRGWNFEEYEFGPNADRRAVSDLTRDCANFRCLSMEEVRAEMHERYRLQSLKAS